METSNLKSDLSAASVRIQARQFLNMIQEPIIANFTSKIDPSNSDPNLKEKLILFFGTDSGKAVFGILVSMLIDTIGLNNEVVKAINKEIRIESMAVIGDEIADVVTGPLRTILCNFTSGNSNDFGININPSIEDGKKSPTITFNNVKAKIKK